MRKGICHGDFARFSLSKRAITASNTSNKSKELSIQIITTKRLLFLLNLKSSLTRQFQIDEAQRRTDGHVPERDGAFLPIRRVWIKVVHHSSIPWLVGYSECFPCPRQVAINEEEVHVQVQVGWQDCFWSGCHHLCYSDRYCLLNLNQYDILNFI